jgi:hypothetical protein
MSGRFIKALNKAFILEGTAGVFNWVLTFLVTKIPVIGIAIGIMLDMFGDYGYHIIKAISYIVIYFIIHFSTRNKTNLCNKTESTFEKIAGIVFLVIIILGYAKEYFEDMLSEIPIIGLLI